MSGSWSKSERAGEHGVLVGGAQGADLNAHGLTVSTRSPGLPLAREAAGAPGARPGGGRFRTRGRYSSATVRGTDWTVTDRCDGTLTTHGQAGPGGGARLQAPQERLGSGGQELSGARQEGTPVAFGRGAGSD